MWKNSINDTQSQAIRFNKSGNLKEQAQRDEEVCNAIKEKFREGKRRLTLNLETAKISNTAEGINTKIKLIMR